MNIEWVDPPPIGHVTRSVAELNEAVAVLKVNPGRWGLVRPGWPTRSGWEGFRSRGCETMIRKAENGWDVFARWPA